MLEPGPSPRSSFALGAALPVYGAVGALAVAVTVALGRSPVTMRGWLGIEGAVAAGLSLGLGALVAVATVASTRVFLRRAAWARALASELRPVVRHADDRTLLVLAFASGVGEELLFRGLLVPTLGVAISTALFGVLHQVRGPGRWAWMGWASVVGLAMALVFALTGSLAGALLAHVGINASNLRLLRDGDFEPKPPRGLGGLLRAPR